MCRPGDGLERLGACRDQSTRHEVEDPAAFHPCRTDGKGGPDDHRDRADTSKWLRDRLVRSLARLEANGQAEGSGDSAVIQNITWTGGHVPTGEDSVFQFLASPDSSKTYTFKVRQSYSDGSVVDWSGPESSDTPAPVIEAKSSLGGGGSSTLAIVALVVAVIAAALAVVALVTRGGSRAVA